MSERDFAMEAESLRYARHAYERSKRYPHNSLRAKFWRHRWRMNKAIAEEYRRGLR